MADLPKLNVVIANNFGHLPMFVGAEKGFFKQHGVDASFRVVDTGTDMVNALHNGEAQVGDMSTTTYLKAVHSGEPFKVIGLIMNDATRDNCDDPLAIVTRKGQGIEPGKIADLKGKTVGLARGQTSDEYLQDGVAPRQDEIRGSHHREHLVAVRSGAGTERRQGRRDRDLGALRDAGARPGARLLSRDPRRAAHVLRDGRGRARADRRYRSRR